MGWGWGVVSFLVEGENKGNSFGLSFLLTAFPLKSKRCFKFENNLARIS